MEANKQDDQLIFNMDRDSNITQINNTESTEPHETKKTRGRPKKEAQKQNNINLNNVSDTQILNLEDKLTKLKKAEAEYNKALEQLRK